MPTPLDGPAFYRAEAENCRKRAAESSDASVASEWTKVAAEYEQMALALDAVTPWFQEDVKPAARAATWRELAERLRAFAATVGEPLAEDNLMNVVREWLRLADRLEKHKQLGVSTTTPPV
jgi:hypothetical protein